MLYPLFHQVTFMLLVGTYQSPTSHLIMRVMCSAAVLLHALQLFLLKQGVLNLQSSVFMYFILHLLYLPFGFVLAELFKSLTGPLTLGRQWKVSIFCYVFLSGTKCFWGGKGKCFGISKDKIQAMICGLGATGMLQISSR